MTALVSVTGSNWTRTNVASVGSGEVTLINGTGSGAAAMWSNEAVGDWRNLTLTWDMSNSNGADWMDVGIWDASAATTTYTTGNTPFSGETAFYGLRFDIYNSQIAKNVAGSVTNVQSYSASQGGAYETWSMTFTDAGSGNMNVLLKRGSTTVNTYSLAAPSYTRARIAISARTGGSTSVYKVRDYVQVSGTTLYGLAYREAQDVDTPIMRWRFEETSGTTATNDGSLSGRTATFTGSYTLGVTPPSGSDEVGYAYSNSSTGYASYDATSAGANVVQCVEWVGVIDSITSGAREAINSQSWSSGNPIGLGLGFNFDGSNNQKLCVGFYNGSSWQVAVWSTTPTTGVQYHIVGKYVAGNLYLFVNGTQVATAAATGFPSASGLTTGWIGRRWDSATETFKGKTYDLALYSAALSDTRIAAHYTSLTGALPGDLAALNGRASNGAVYLWWTAPSGATSYDIYDGTTTTNVATTSTYLSATNGVTKTYTVTPKNIAGTGASKSVTLTPTTDVIVFDTFDRTENPISTPTVGSAPVVAVGQANGSNYYGGFAIYDVTVTDNLAIEARLAAVDTGTAEMMFVTSYDTVNSFFSYVRWAIGSSQQASLWRKTGASTFVNDLAVNAKYPDTATGTLRNLAVGDVVKVLLRGGTTTVYVNNVAILSAEWRTNLFSKNKVGIYSPSTVWQFDWLRIYSITSNTEPNLPAAVRSASTVPSVATNDPAFVYRGRANKTLDSGGGA